MRTLLFSITALFTILAVSCSDNQKNSKQPEMKTETAEFPSEIVAFTPYDGNPVFAGTGTAAWDKTIRERGYVFREDGIWHMWYTGYNDDIDGTKYLGYATSPDGISWTRYSGNPVYSGSWTEDMHVVKHDGTYYMAAEGENDIAHMMTSADGVSWTNHGDIDIRYTNGEPLSEGPYGTPTFWVEDGIWYLFYERNDEAVWLAVTDDMKFWTNVRDEPVISPGPAEYDKVAIALNQVVKHNGKYYAWYHGTGHDPWRDWTTNVAVSDDLINWKKYPGNPVVDGDRSSGILVHDGDRYRLYTMHPDVRVYFPNSQSE